MSVDRSLGSASEILTAVETMECCKAYKAIAGNMGYDPGGLAAAIRAAISFTLNKPAYAAAPDMYEALKEAPLPVNFTSARSFSNAYSQWLIKKFAAIAKAEGRNDSIQGSAAAGPHTSSQGGE